MAILLDQYVLDGAPIEFLGHPAPTGTAIAALAARFGVPMIPAYGTRAADGVEIAIDFEAPIAPGSAEAMTQAAADSLSARVRARPGQYYWLHRRWVKRFGSRDPAVLEPKPAEGSIIQVPYDLAAVGSRERSTSDVNSRGNVPTLIGRSARSDRRPPHSELYGAPPR